MFDSRWKKGNEEQAQKLVLKFSQLKMLPSVELDLVVGSLQYSYRVFFEHAETIYLTYIICNKTKSSNTIKKN